MAQTHVVHKAHLFRRATQSRSLAQAFHFLSRLRSPARASAVSTPKCELSVMIYLMRTVFSLLLNVEKVYHNSCPKHTKKLFLDSTQLSLELAAVLLT